MKEIIVACSQVISWHFNGVDDKSFRKPSESVAELGQDTKRGIPNREHECDTIGRSGQIYFVMCLIFRCVRA